MSRQIPRDIEGNLGAVIEQFQKFIKMLRSCSSTSPPPWPAGETLATMLSLPSEIAAAIQFITGWIAALDDKITNVNANGEYYVNNVFQSIRGITPGLGSYANEVRKTK
jgi:hypothetical protein